MFDGVKDGSLFHGFGGSSDLGTDTIIEDAGEGTNDNLSFGNWTFDFGVNADLASQAPNAQISNGGTASLKLNLNWAPGLDSIYATAHDDILSGNSNNNVIYGRGMFGRSRSALSIYPCQDAIDGMSA